MGRLTSIIAAICLLAALSGCNTSGCLENRSSVPLVGFYDSATEKSISLDSLEIYGADAPGDSILSAPGTPISQIYLPMRATKDNVMWFIAYKWKNLDNLDLVDRIDLDYMASPYFASEECGVIYRYRITRCQYTRNLIDSIAITDSLITNIDTERIKIFFRTSADDEPEDQPQESPQP